MRIQTILNRVEKYKRFVYGGAKFEELADGLALVVPVRPRRNSRPECSGCGRRCATYDRMREPRLFEFGGNGCYLSREVRFISSSSQALQLGDQLRKTIVAADIEEASALIALETINLLAGVSDEPFRMNLRRRVAERLAQTPTISVT